jgi:hypothetical protein
MGRQAYPSTLLPQAKVASFILIRALLALMKQIVNSKLGREHAPSNEEVVR